STPYSNPFPYTTLFRSMQKIVLKDIAYLSAAQELKEKLDSLPVYNITKKDKNIVVIDSFLIIEHINKEFPDIEIQVIGPTYTIRSEEHTSELQSRFDIV